MQGVGAAPPSRRRCTQAEHASRPQSCIHRSRVVPSRQRRSLQLGAGPSSAAVPELALKSLAGAAGGAISKLQRYVQPPPAGFPSGPSGDQSVFLLQNPLEFITRLRRDHGPVVGMLLGGERVVLVSDPPVARQILIDRPDVFVKAGTAFFPGSSLTGNGLLVSDGDVWRRQRRMSNPAFRKAAVDKYAQEMIAATQDLLNGPFATAADSRSSHRTSAAAVCPGVRDVYADFNQLTLNITLAALFGIRTDSSSSSSSSGSSSSTASRVVSAVEKAFTYFAARGATAMVVPEWVPTPDNVAFKDAVQQLDDLVYGIIDDRKAEMAQQQQQPQGLPAAGSSFRTDLLQALLDSTDESGQPMARSALRDELMTLLVAGQETSAILLGWASALLAHSPKVQAAAAAEVQQALGGKNSSSSGGACTELAPGDIAKLPFTTAVVFEALRLYSPAYMVGRCACMDIDLVGGHQLPAGTTVLVSPYLLHREPNRWKQPSVFNPERWMPLLTGSQQQQQPQQEQHHQQNSSSSSKVNSSSGCPVDHDSSSRTNSSNGCSVGHSSTGSSSSSSSKSSSYGFMSVLRDLGPNGAYMPFGGGPRNCIGTGFAMMEAVLVLAMLLQRYELQPASPASGLPRPKPMLTLRPEAVPLRVIRRYRA